MKPTRREFLTRIGCGAAAISALSMNRCARQKPSEDLPNVIYILADDLGYGDLGVYGQKEIATPHLDRMAREGMLFRDHYAGCTVCAPSRCSLMTGKHTGHCTVRGNVDVLMKPEEPTIATVMKQAGYATACIGKWGIGHPPPPEDPHRHGFDHFFGYLSMWHAHNYYPDFLWRNGMKLPLRNIVQHPEKHYKEGQEELVGLASEKVDYSSDVFTEDALSFMGKQKGPFFLYLSYTIPHANNEAEWFDEHGMEVPDLGQYKEKDWPEPEKGKAAMISRMDSDIGRLFEKLSELGIDGNTLVLFSSDNGPHKEGGVDPKFFNSSGGLKGTKRDLYEGGIRVPMIARWPGKIAPGQESSHISAFWDVLPTLAEVAGEKPPEGIDGISFLPTLLGREQPQHEFLYWEFHEGSSKQAVRLGQWKAVRVAPSRPIEIYDLLEDSAEEKNVAEQVPEIVAKVEGILAQVRTDEELWPLNDKAEKMPF